MTAFIATTSTHTVTTTVKANNEANAPLSIRQIIMRDIEAGVDKKLTQAKIEQFHPTSAACAKFAIHYGWYKGTMKKAGILFGSGAAQVQETSGYSCPFSDIVIEEDTTIADQAAALAAAIDAEQNAA